MDKYQKFLDIVKKHHPNLKEDQIRVFEDGWDRVVILADRIVYSFPRYKGAEEVLPAIAKFTQEFSKISPIKIPVMNLHQNSLVYVSYQFIEGVQLKKEVYSQIPKPKQLKIARKIGQFLKAIHTFSVDKALSMGVLNTGSVMFTDKEVKEIKDRVYPVIEQAERDWIDEFFNYYFSLYNDFSPKPTVIHSDMQPEHIIVNAQTGELSGIIDFNDLEVADPAYDFRLLDWYYGEIFLEEAYKEYNLQKDKTWNERRRWYAELRMVSHLNHSLQLKDEERIKKHKHRLQEFVKTQQVNSLDYNL